jgi:hypothetical protein
MGYRYYHCPRTGRSGYGHVSSFGTYTGYLGRCWKWAYNPLRW